MGRSGRSDLPASFLRRFLPNTSKPGSCLSSIALMEREHGLGAVAISVEPFTREMGVLAARIDANMKKVGLVIPTADLLIGITALHLDYAIGTRNVLHFRMVPGLKVLSL